MATPIISTLRRNQGYILAVMGVVLIFTWVIGQPAIEFFSGGASRGRQQTKTAVVQWNKAGTPQFLSEGDLEHLRQEHMVVLDFVHRVVKKAVDGHFTPQAPGLNLTPNQRGEINLGLAMDNSEATVVNILLFAELGKERGVRVDRTAMVNYLKNLSGFSMEEGDFREIAKETVDNAVKSGRMMSVDSLFAALRKELTSQQALHMFGASVSNVSTGELWDLHKQLNLRYKIEAYPIHVEKLKANFKAADAKPDELMALFNKGKDRVPDPAFPDPGFKTPHRIAFGYCTVDYEVFLNIARKNVPEANAVERYKTGIAAGDFRKPPKLPGTEKPKETTPDEPKPDEPKPGEEKPAGEEKKPVEPEKKKEEPKSGEPKPAEEKPAEKGAKPAAEQPAEKPAAEKPSAEKPASVAVVCDDEAKKAKSDEPKPTETKPAEKVPAKDETKPEPAKTEPAKTEPGNPEPSKSEPAKTEPAKTPDSATPAGEKTEDPAKPEKKVEEEVIEHRTYEEVRNEILTELAQKEAAELRQTAVESALEELRAYSAKLKRYQESKKDKQDKLVEVENPGEFHPVAFANKHKFAYGKTNLVDRYQADSTELGKNAILQSTQGSFSFAQFAFFGSPSLYDPQGAVSIGETQYIYWRIDDQPEQEAALDKDGSLPPAVKAQVEEAWLKEKAFAAAKQRAEELAAKAKGTSLRELVGKTEEAKVVLPVPFSMFTTNGTPLYYPPPYTGRTEFSEPNGIPMAGKEFMDAVFSLKPGEATVAVDQPHDTVYAVHVLAEEPSLEIRREMFLTSLQRGQFTDLMGFADIEKRREMQSLFDDMEKHFSVKWTRPANLGRGGEE